MNRLFLISIAILALVSTVFMISKSSYESADYKVIETDGMFEIRKYQPMIVVSTNMSTADSRSGSAFGRLFGYISGANNENQKIAMTSPVLTSNEDGSSKMSFLVPKGIAEKGAPLPNNQDVELETIPGGRFASITFRGYASNSKYENAAGELTQWLKTKGLESLGEPIYAGYDPPYTPGSQRRNEVLIRLAE